MQYYVYILFSKPNGTLYIGVLRRMYEHKNKLSKGFTAKYNVDRLGYYEIYENIEQAITREKSLKGSSRQKKINLILSKNPYWIDLYDELL